MSSDHRRRALRIRSSRVAAVGLALTLLTASAVAASTRTARTTKHSGTVTVLYAGSLIGLMLNSVAPAFHQATGYTMIGFGAGSTALANQIKGGTQVGDVFISASPTADALLEGTSNGSWVSSYKVFGTSGLVLGYNPGSTFVHDLKTMPWYNVIDLSGFLIGRTDPATDPKGVLTVNAINGVALSYGVPALTSVLSTNSNVFPEQSLVGRLQAGQLDAGFFYRVEAISAGLKVVPLTGVGLGATYTIALLANAPHTAAGRAFVAFLLSKNGRKILRSNGVVPIVPPTVVPYTPSPTTTTTAAG